MFSPAVERSGAAVGSLVGLEAAQPAGEALHSPGFALHAGRKVKFSSVLGEGEGDSTERGIPASMRASSRAGPGDTVCRGSVGPRAGRRCWRCFELHHAHGAAFLVLLTCSSWCSMPGSYRASAGRNVTPPTGRGRVLRGRTGRGHTARPLNEAPGNSRTVL